MDAYLENLASFRQWLKLRAKTYNRDVHQVLPSDVKIAFNIQWAPELKSGEIAVAQRIADLLNEYPSGNRVRRSRVKLVTMTAVCTLSL